MTSPPKNEIALRPEIPAELMNYWRENLKEDLHMLMKETIREQVDLAASIALEQVQQEADKLKEKINRQETTINLYKRDVKTLQQEVSSMAHKKVEEEDVQLEKDKKIAVLEKKIAQMELERASFRLDDLDKQEKNRRDIKLLKAAIITITTGGLGVHTLISEVIDEKDIRDKVKKGTRYHQAALSLQKTNETCAAMKAQNDFENRHRQANIDTTPTIGNTF